MPRHRLYEKTIGAAAKHLRTNESVYTNYLGGIAFGGLYSIPKATSDTYHYVKYGKKVDRRDTVASLLGTLSVMGYDKFLRPVGTGTISHGRFLAGQLIKPAAPLLVPAAVIAVAHHNVTAPPPPEYQQQNSPWYFAVAQALTGGVGIGTAGSSFV